MDKLELILPTSIKNELIEHAKSLAPIESCGYLSGNNDTVTRFFPMTNIDQSPEHFSFDPKEQFAVVKDVRNQNEKIMAVYHSHPETPARLSDEDIRLFNDPDPVYIIVSLKDAEAQINGFKVEKPNENEIKILKVNLIIKDDNNEIL